MHYRLQKPAENRSDLCCYMCQASWPAAANPGFAKSGMVSATGVWGEAASGVWGQSPWGRSGSEAESFLSIFIQKSGQKLRVLIKLAPVSEADCLAQLRPALSFGQWGEGQPPGPPIHEAGSATAGLLSEYCEASSVELYPTSDWPC